mmetsp:Transcript_23435/g.72737  ORF Transcript_23435/g.72737 Transcript_23435/m.72737 type:complete len:302 (+) Transcript_23435:72-977(+)
MQAGRSPAAANAVWALCLLLLLRARGAWAACLCVFDIDRTLTSKQGPLGARCPGSQVVPGVQDNAYGGGELRLSALAAAGINTTFCGDCYLGLCSHGDANQAGSQERWQMLHRVLVSKPQAKLRLSPLNAPWSDEAPTPYFVRAPDGFKQDSVAKIVEWYQRQGVDIERRNVYFFDDRAGNVRPFRGSGMNARQISCASRDGELGQGAVGFCGATPAELVREPGVQTCQDDCTGGAACHGVHGRSVGEEEKPGAGPPVPPEQPEAPATTPGSADTVPPEQPEAPANTPGSADTAPPSDAVE